ncbi:MAG: PP2C family protein-serine/threonine phosphatase, partial [Candidatus Latescibacterota bacterium]
ANSVGGDYYAYRWLDKEKTKLSIVVADVSGKAMEAAVTALRFNEMLRYECEGRTEPAEILDGLNASLEDQIDLATFITCCVVVLDVSTGEVQVANAGHCPPVLVKDTAELIDLNGYPLGLPKIVRPDEPYDTVCFALSPGDRLVLYSDGVVEAQNARHHLFDDDRFLRLLERAGAEMTSEDLIQKTVTQVTSFIGDAPRTDDITMVVLQREVS